MKKYILILVLLFSYFISNAQWGTFEEIFDDGNVQVEVQYKLASTSCSANKTNKYRFNVSGTLYSYDKEFYWKLKYRNCEGNIVDENIEIVIGGSNAASGLVESMDYTFMGKLMTQNQQSFGGTSANSPTINLSQKEYNAFKDYSLRKVKDLGRYIRVMTDKTVSSSVQSNAVDAAVKLFLSESNIVQVSSINTDIVKEYKVRTYFNRIRVLKYSKIDVSWYDIQYVSNLRQGPDGKYYGVVTIFQKFTGYNGEGRPVYSDITQKNIEIIVDVKDDALGKKQWTVYLGNISVVETK